MRWFIASFLAGSISPKVIVSPIASGHRKFGPFVDPGSKALGISRNDDKTMPTVELVDSNKVSIRYYRWLKNKTIKSWDDLNVPVMVVGPEYKLYTKDTPAAQQKTTSADITAR